MTIYIKICPRGFANEVAYIKVMPAETIAAEALITDFCNRMEPNGYADWSTDLQATRLGVAVDWADRHWIV